MTRLVLVRLAIVVALTVGFAAIRIHDDPEHARPPHPARPVAGVAIAQDYPDVLGVISDARAEWIENEERLERERAEAAAEAERLAAARRAANQPVARPRVDAHSEAWWHAIAICEQGGRNDPFYGYFSIMDGSAGGLDWATQVAMANAIIARAGDSAWAASCVAQAYAAAPGG